MLRIAGKTDVGKKRAANEDGFFVAKLSSDAPTQWSAMEWAGKMADM